MLKLFPNVSVVMEIGIFKTSIIAELLDVSGSFLGLGKFGKYWYTALCVVFHIR